MKNTTEKKRLPLMTMVVLGVISFFALAMGGFVIHSTAQSSKDRKRWVQGEAKVLGNAHVHTNSNYLHDFNHEPNPIPDDFDHADNLKRQSKRTRVGYLTVPYEHTVGGNRYKGWIYSRSPQPLTDLDRIRQQFPKGQTITIYYDPASPVRSMIRPSAGASSSVPGIILLAVGGTLMIAIPGIVAVKRLG